MYAFTLLPILTTLAGDSENFLGRTLLSLPIPGYKGQNGKLLLFFVVVVEISDVFQYIWGKCLGKKKIIPKISPNKTWEGFVGGIMSASFVGMGLWWTTPLSPLQALVMSFIITLVGFGGEITMSAIKRDLGVKDYSTLIPGHGGILDRIASLCFAAPIFST